MKVARPVREEVVATYVGYLLHTECAGSIPVGDIDRHGARETYIPWLRLFLQVPPVVSWLPEPDQSGRVKQRRSGCIPASPAPTEHGTDCPPAGSTNARGWQTAGTGIHSQPGGAEGLSVLSDAPALTRPPLWPGSKPAPVTLFVQRKKAAASRVLSHSGKRPDASARLAAHAVSRRGNSRRKSLPDELRGRDSTNTIWRGTL